MWGKVGTARAIAGIAALSHGVVTRRKLLAAGIDRRQIDRGLRTGYLIAVHRGVYRVGHAAPSLEARYIAAVLACGDRAVLGGQAAAFLWRLLKGRPPPPSALAPTERRVKGVACRQCRRLEPADLTVCREIPVTTVARTLVDLAPHLPSPALARACHEAGVLHRTTPAQVEAVLARRPNSPGSAALRAVIRGEVPVTLSKLESGFLGLLRANRLPLPLANRRFGSRRLDCHWPAERLVVELDSYRYHASRHAWEEDRRRERMIRARGLEFRRYTWGDVFEQPGPMLRELRRLLAGSAAMPPPG